MEGNGSPIDRPTDLAILLDLALGDDDQGRGPARLEAGRGGGAGEGGGPWQRGGTRRRRHCVGGVCCCSAVSLARKAFLIQSTPSLNERFGDLE